MTGSSRPFIAFCTTVKGRLQHLVETLPKNLADNAAYENSKFIVLDYNSQDDLLGYLKTHHEASIKSGRLVVYSFLENVPFRMAHAKNMAHRLGVIEGAKILVNLDADNFTGPGFAEYIAKEFSREETPFLWANRNQPSPIRYPKGCNGRIVVSSEAFIKTGGYDEEKYNQWGPDDKDFHCRLRRFGYIPCEISREFLNVILHNDKLRFREYPDVAVDIKDESFQEVDETVTVSNYGGFGCGVVFKNFDFFTPVQLSPLPTRLFGIGMHKTGTTSLHHALEILGYDSAHWKSVRWAKRIWTEMMTTGRSPTVERHYALSDIPIPMLFRQLDRAYPNSKFILTLRDERRWLRSVENHWSRWNNFRDTWKKEDGFSQQIHKELYGQSEFDAAIFLARYRRHNAEVLEYFKDRPADLLVMNIESDSNWQKLCSFLGRPIPLIPYPRENPGASQRAPMLFDASKIGVKPKIKPTLRAHLALVTGLLSLGLALLLSYGVSTVIFSVIGVVVLSYWWGKRKNL